MKILLASASPRRRELLAPLCPFEVEISRFQEHVEGSAEETVLRNARGKALEVLGRFPERRVLGADTAVALNGVILGKPKDAGDAKRMLRFLSGKTHSVFTGVCLADKYGVKERVVETKVLFKELSEETIESYVSSGAPLDKAGAYGIQDGVVVKSYEGSYSNVMGLPTEAVEEMLRI
ncbi:MAG: Maf family protein [Clostridiales bacterium]|nr:Maf family protein [Clostridiales bacterium]